MLLSLLMMVTDSRYHYLNGLRQGFSTIISPFQYVVDYPLSLIGSVHTFFTSKKTLIKENIELRQQQTLLAAELQQLLSLQDENSQLKGLLRTATKPTTRSMAAQILALEASHSRQLLILDKGKQEGVYVGQPVLDAKGVVGQIIDVGRLTSTVLMISDSKSAVPVRIHRSGEHAILTGKNNPDALSLINLPKTSTVKTGDILVTSGLGRLYPEGYPVGEVKVIENIPGEAFIKIEVHPFAQLNRTRLVLLIWTDENRIALNNEVKDRFKQVDSIA